MDRSGAHRISLTDRQLLALPAAGIWNQVPAAVLFAGGAAWADIYQLAYEQTIVGHVTDGINLLPETEMPSVEELDPFLGDLMGTEQRNRQLDSFLPFLFKALSPLPVVLIKGQSLSQDYPDPLRRQPGDIDLLLPPSCYEKAKAILLPKASRVQPEEKEIYHQGFFYRSIEVEIHGSIQTLMSPRLDRKLARLQAEMFDKRETCIQIIDGHEIPVPNPGFNAIYILVHFLHHFWAGGVGLRQLTDWMVFVSVHKREIDPILLEERLADLGLKAIWQTFAGFAVDYLGCPSEKMPLYTDRYARRYPRIWGWLKRSGNFGKKTEKARVKEPYLIRKLHSFYSLVLVNRLRHLGTFPLESLRYFAGAFAYGLGRLSRGE